MKPWNILLFLNEEKHNFDTFSTFDGKAEQAEDTRSLETRPRVFSVLHTDL